MKRANEEKHILVIDSKAYFLRKIPGKISVESRKRSVNVDRKMRDDRFSAQVWCLFSKYTILHEPHFPGMGGESAGFKHRNVPVSYQSTKRFLMLFLKGIG